jgi:glycosyltransferase involved in cell wall biosynthesis
MLVTVLVPTRNRLRSLKNLLESFELAICPEGSEVEIIIIDNASDDGTALMLSREAQKNRRFPLKVLQEKKKGKANALNLGLSTSRGNVLLIVDDDVVVGVQIFAEHVRAYLAGSFDAVQGRILPGRDPLGQAADPHSIREYNIPHIDYGDQMREIRGLTGTNMSFKREVFEKVGFFDSRLGPGAAGFSEDTEYSIRIRKAGFKVGYTPNAVVYHELDPNRYGRRYNRMVEYRKGLSRSLYRRDSIVFNVLPNLVANCMRYGLYRLLGKTQKAYKTEGRIMKCWGYLAGKARGVAGREPRSEV